MTIGSNCSFGAYNHITCANRVEIGDSLLTGKWVTITDNSHGETDKTTLGMRPQERPITSKGPVIIGNNVWIGDKATILPGVTIGDGAVIPPMPLSPRMFMHIVWQLEILQKI